jgi:hypothetical protein
MHASVSSLQYIRREIYSAPLLSHSELLQDHKYTLLVNHTLLCLKLGNNCSSTQTFERLKNVFLMSSANARDD